jgi:hypothetical protein
MPITLQGALNTTALTTPDIYIQIVQPNAIVINGVPTNDLGIVGTATWGPVGVPVNLGNPGGYLQAFGPVQARLFDMGTEVAIAFQQGANNMTCVRVTDGTDTAATIVVPTAAITLTALYTGTAGNGAVLTLAAGSIASTFTATVAMPNQPSEIYPNIAGTGNAFWIALAAAINNGLPAYNRPKSRLITALAGVGTTAPAAASYTLAGGTDGVTTVTSATLVGTDTAPRKGMYALRKQGVSVLNLAGCTDSTQWSNIQAFAVQESMYAVVAFAAAPGIPAASVATNAALLATAGIANFTSGPWMKVMMGDWVYWSDTTNNVVRLVSPAGFVAGLISALSPQLSTLNKPIYGVVSSQQTGLPGTGQAQAYAGSDLQAIFAAGMDVLTNPVPGGNYWACRGGFNASPVAGLNDDSYTRMTNYIAVTLNAAMGKYVGQTITPALLTAISTSLSTYLNTLLAQGLLGLTISTAGATNGNPILPFSVVCNGTNNPFSRTSIGYVQADVQVQFLGINKNFIVNLQGGSTVVVSHS